MKENKPEQNRQKINLFFKKEENKLKHSTWHLMEILFMTVKLVGMPSTTAAKHTHAWNTHIHMPTQETHIPTHTGSTHTC